MLYSSAERGVLKDLAGLPQILQRWWALAIAVLAITSLSDSTLINSWTLHMLEP
jgi:hypothetical protein